MTTSEKTMVLVIDDEVQIRRLLRLGLESHGFRVQEAQDGKSGLAQAASFLPQLIILDLALPDMTGLEVLQQLREWTKVPIVILSVQNDESDKVAALDCGADDYVNKPFGMNELLARIRVALRHSAKNKESESSVFLSAGLKVDFTTRTVSIADKEIHLTKIEYDLLSLFIQHAGKVLTHKQILKKIWGPNSGEQTHYLRVYVGSLRKKIELDPSQPAFVLTESGIGYRFRG